MTKTNTGIDDVARGLGNMVGASYFTGTSTTAPTATTFTFDGATLVASSGTPGTGGATGYVVVRAGVYGTIISNTTTVGTIDYWHDPTNPGRCSRTSGAKASSTTQPMRACGWCFRASLTAGM